MRSFWSSDALKYGLCLGLIGFYAVVVTFALSPNASAEHQAYFIDRTSTCHHNRPPASIAPSGGIRFGANRPAQSCTTLVEGWDWQQPWGTWSVGDVSRIRFEVVSDAHATADLLFHVLGFAPLDEPKACVYVDGVFAGEWQLPHEHQTTFELPIPIVAGRQPVELTFFFSNPQALRWFGKSTNPIDQRLISMGLLGFQWVEHQNLP